MSLTRACDNDQRERKQADVHKKVGDGAPSRAPFFGASASVNPAFTAWGSGPVLVAILLCGLLRYGIGCACCLPQILHRRGTIEPTTFKRGRGSQDGVGEPAKTAQWDQFSEMRDLIRIFKNSVRTK